MSNLLFNRKSIRGALKLLADADGLGRHPLADLHVVKRQQKKRPFANTSTGRGLALRHLLYDFIADSRPSGSQPDFSQRRWRWYTILQEQFINGRRAQEIRYEMGVSESGYFNDQRRALDELGNRLQEAEMAVETMYSADSAQTVFIATPSPFLPISPAPNLPEHPTPFIGREAELQQIGDLFRNPECRLLTLTGPGGIGKTRLAAQAAKMYADLFPMGVYFVPLAPLESADFTITAVAKTLGFTFDNQQDQQSQLLDFLRQKALLLVMDNFEHMMTAAPLVSDILHYAPAIKIMITSRERLNVRGEWVIEMRGLNFPAEVSSASQYDSDMDAVQLFLQAVERARGQRPFSPEEMPHVVHICQLVHGLPLALELAAGWSTLISCAEIAAEIEKSLDFLDGTFRDLPQRHQSLRAVFDHSWNLLTDSERQIFRKLSRFRGSYDRVAAQQIAGAGLADLLALSGKSLLRRQSSGRYQTHELLRQFAAEKLAALPDEYAETCHAHGRFFANFLNQRNNALKQGGEQTKTLAAIEQEFENVWAAWEWAIRGGETAVLHQMAEPLRHVYFMQNRYRQGEETFGRLVESGIERRLSGLALGFQGGFTFRLGRWERARRHLGESLTILQEEGTDYDRALVGMLAIRPALLHPEFTPEKLYAESTAVFTAMNDEWGLAACDYEMGEHVYETGGVDKHGKTRHLLAQSLARRQKIGDVWGESACLYYLGHTAFTRGDYDESQWRTEQSLQICRTIGDQLGIADAYHNLGQITTARGEYAAARSYYNKMLAIREEYGNRKRIAECLDCLGYVAYLSRDDETAVSYYDKSLVISRETNDTHGTAWSLHNLGDIARRRGAYQEAMTLYQESQEIHKANDPFDWGRAVALEKLGRTALMMGDLDEAEYWFGAAFQIAMKMKRYRDASDALLGMTQLWLQRGGDEAMALQFITAVLSHKATAQDTRDKAQRLALSLVEKLDDETAVSAQKEGTKLTFAETAGWLLIVTGQ